MPDSYGHAKDFYLESIRDGELNPQRDLVQFSNPSKQKPKANDLIVMSPTRFNPYGHVAIVSEVVGQEGVEVIQQNPGAFSSSRESMDLYEDGDGKWKIDNDRVLGWLRKRWNHSGLNSGNILLNKQKWSWVKFSVVLRVLGLNSIKESLIG